MQQEIGEMLKHALLWALDIRGELIRERLVLMDDALKNEDNLAIYRHLFELARLTEMLCKELRAPLGTFYNDLQLTGMFHPLVPYPQADMAAISVEGNCLRLEFSGLLPFSAGGSAHYLHEQVYGALSKAIREQELPQPFFKERCVVVFIHHYKAQRGAARHLRDYDNLEHRCITNVLASLAMRGDGPNYMIAMDLLAPGDRDFTEVRMMPLADFKQFVMSENLGFSTR